jgi:hypothetical protein
VRAEEIVMSAVAQSSMVVGTDRATGEVVEFVAGGGYRG